MYGERIERWESVTEWPLAGAALVFLVAYATPILTDVSGAVAVACEVAIGVTWVIFLADYLVRLALAERRLAWFLRHPLDLAIVALPMLRPLRLVRFLTVVSIVGRGAGNALRGRVVAYAMSATILIGLIASLAVLDAERSSTGPITTFGDALWWAMVTVTTVGYGDYYPVTPTGRAVAAGLMIGGIALIGVVTATLASWIVEKATGETQTAAERTGDDIAALRAEVAELKQLIVEQSGVRRE
ncbi:potassium channel family protein [Tessaracoccus palaemonis]|uniref:Potassium channel family protein n=1 Tax=Tessaracoccus palaemonis TaxID=2829499 RepID=A0ABX8SJD6_9ACTN|nr:potassium channel family protein [Tessaracoccus palaemonis]QXT63481.1 potassium channel family protein [Tessaracoccus palaemonis]